MHKYTDKPMEKSRKSRVRPNQYMIQNMITGANHWDKNNLPNKWNNWISIWKKMRLDPFLTPYIRINSNESEI